jgi:hypothetical protein
LRAWRAGKIFSLMGRTDKRYWDRKHYYIQIMSHISVCPKNPPLPPWELFH